MNSDNPPNNKTDVKPWRSWTLHVVGKTSGAGHIYGENVFVGPEIVEPTEVITAKPALQKIAELETELAAYRNQAPEDFLTPYENELLGDLKISKDLGRKLANHNADYSAKVAKLDAENAENERLVNYWYEKHLNRVSQNIELNNRITNLEKLLDEAKGVITFYSDLYVFDENWSDEDCEQDIGKPWRYVSGKKARAFLQRLTKLDEEIK